LVSELAMPAYLPSVAGSGGLILQLPPNHYHSTSGVSCATNISACIEWNSRSGSSAVPDVAAASKQKTWNRPLVLKKIEEVMSAALTQSGRARILAATAPHASDFWNAVPCLAVGTRLDDTSLRIAVA
jgi:hypothetical protein